MNKPVIIVVSLVLRPSWVGESSWLPGPRLRPSPAWTNSPNALRQKASSCTEPPGVPTANKRKKLSGTPSNMLLTWNAPQIPKLVWTKTSPVTPLGYWVTGPAFRASRESKNFPKPQAAPFPDTLYLFSVQPEQLSSA